MMFVSAGKGVVDVDAVGVLGYWEGRVKSEE
jgi:hypothetical protein